MDEQTVLVTGAAGCIGASLVAALRRQGRRVTGTVRPGGSGAPGSIELDLYDTGKVVRAVRELAPRAIVHCAVERRLDASDARYPGCQAALVEGLLAAAADLPLARFVHSSTQFEYPRLGRPLLESDSGEPPTAYGRSKARATALCLEAARAGLPVVVLRPFTVYGPGEAPRRLVPSALRAALAGTTLPLTRPGLRRDYVYIDDVVDAYLRALDAPLEPGETFNVASGTEVANEELVALVERVTGRRVRTEPGAYEPHVTDSEHWVGDATRAAFRLGWRARTSLEQGLARTLAWLRT